MARVILVAFLLPLLMLADRTLAGLGPHNVAVVVNSGSPSSLAVANEYIDARNISACNVIYIDVPVGSREGIGIDNFRSTILNPVLDQIRERLLDGQIDCIAYSADFPHVVDIRTDIGDRKMARDVGTSGSINGMTYLYNYVLRKDLAYCSLNINRYAPPVHHVVLKPDQTITMIPPRGFRRATGWNADGSPMANRPDRGYMLSTVLGVTAGRGNTLDEVRQMIRRSASADGTAPRGTVYYMFNGDVRSTARQWGFKPAAAKLMELGVSAQVMDGTLPREKADVMGAMIGIADFNWSTSGSTILPGAICEHLTSFGGVMWKGSGQTPISAFVRAGASGTSGTVTEPLAIQEKFPSPFIHAYYASGCSLAEAYYQSVSGPYQLLIIGDPLCKPWGKVPSLTLGIETGATLKGVVKLKPTNHTGTYAAVQFALLVDGEWQKSILPNQEATLDTADLTDGYHELRLLSIASDAIASYGQSIIPVTVDNHGQRVVITPPKSSANDAAGPIVIDASMKGAKRLILVHNGRDVATTAGEAGSLRVDASVLGSGPVRVQAVGVLGEGKNEERVASEPIRLEIASPK